MRHSGNKIKRNTCNSNISIVEPSTLLPQSTTKTKETPVVVKSSANIQHTFTKVPLKSHQSNTYTLEEVATHNTSEDCWLIVHGRVYDVTSVLSSGSHPGSANAIMRHAGKVCDEDFDFHSRAARKFWLKHYCIGKIQGHDNGFLSSCLIS